MSQGFDALQSHATRLRAVPLNTLLAREPDRVAAHTLRTGPLYFNFARQSYDASAWQALLAQGEAVDLAGAFRRLFDGDQVNVTEGARRCIPHCVAGTRRRSSRARPMRRHSTSASAWPR